jgi:cardiolipin synthase
MLGGDPGGESVRLSVVRQRGFATLPNLLSLLRIVLLPVSIWTLERQSSAGVIPVLLVIGCALGTDALDGLLARWHGATSDVGKIVDPLADKIYLGGLLIYLGLERGFPLWIVGILVGRDLLLVIGGAILVRKYGAVFGANIWGKISTIILGVLVFAYILRTEWILSLLSALAVATLVVSFCVYAGDAMRFVREHSNPQRS